MIYPNPTNDKIYLHNYEEHNGFLTISDIYGRILLYRKIDSNTVDISNLRPGIYIVSIVCSNNVVTRKLIKK